MYTCIQARCVRYIKIYYYILVEYFIVHDIIVYELWEFCRDHSLVLDNRLIVFRAYITSRHLIYAESECIYIVHCTYR